MTAKDLMNPRFEVIGSYPKSPFNVGDVIDRIKRATNDYFHIDENSPVGGIVPFNAGVFYGCGYCNTYGPVYTLKKKWHYHPARLCEWVRLKLPLEIGKAVFGF